jgi:tyrosinase
LELVNWSSTVFFFRISISDGCIDAPDFFESSFWKDSNALSGLGGWGNPSADFSVPDGGFDEFHLSYPSSHILRRDFTLYPFAVPDPLFTDHLKEGNATFSVSVIEAALQTSAGDFKGFQKALEMPEVRS